MTTTYRFPLLLLVAFGAGCDSATAPDARLDRSTLALSQTAAHTAAAGTFNQTAITSLDVSQAGPNTILQQTSAGSVSGTLSGSYTDDLRVVIHPNGLFTAHFTIRCECTVDGEQGVLDLVASDRGRLVSPTLASFVGHATIIDGSGDLADVRGVLQIEGTVDLVTGLSTYTYSGRIH